MRDVEMRIEDGEDIAIKEIKSPTSIELVKEVKVKSSPGAVCQYKGCTYVGCENGDVFKIDGEGCHTSSLFIKLDTWICGIIANKDRLYILMYGNGSPYSVFLYNLRGERLYSWKHRDSIAASRSRVFSVMNDHLLIAGRTKKNFSFTKFTLDGEYSGSVGCEDIKNDLLSFCNSSDNSIIVTNHGVKNKLFKLNLDTSAIEWETSDTGEDPIGVCKLNEDFALVTSNYSEGTILRVFNHNTGR